VQTSVSARSPHYIRIEKEKLPNLDRAEKFEITSPYGYSLLAKGKSKKILIVSTGALTHRVHKMTLQLESELGSAYSIIDLHRIKPVSLEAVELICSYENVITIEEGYTTGLGAALLNAIHSSKDPLGYPQVRCLGVDENYIFDAGSRELLQELYGPLKMMEQLIRSNHKM
jgi:transketolase C-terminal domain/subunit